VRLAAFDGPTALLLVDDASWHQRNRRELDAGGMQVRAGCARREPAA
jgi:hypothetical protein